MALQRHEHRALDYGVDARKSRRRWSKNLLRGLLVAVLGVCATGVQTCVDTTIACVQVTQSSAETCDGADNDCDGASNEGNPDGGGLCNTGLQGVCAAGALQ